MSRVYPISLGEAQSSAWRVFVAGEAAPVFGPRGDGDPQRRIHSDAPLAGCAEGLSA